MEKPLTRPPPSGTLSLGERVARCPDALHREAGRVRGCLGTFQADLSEFVLWRTVPFPHRFGRSHMSGPRPLKPDTWHLTPALPAPAAPHLAPISGLELRQQSLLDGSL